MTANWRAGLVNAFPVPQDRRLAKVKRKFPARHNENIPIPVEKVDETPLDVEPFEFFGLPGEIRNRIYRLVLFAKDTARGPFDEPPIHGRTSILRATKKLHQES